jgi:hypothetical protein
MAVTEQQIQSIIDQLEKFGDDDSAFDTWMTTIATVIRSHGDVGQFRTSAKTLWLTRNKVGLHKILWDILSGPTREEQHAQAQGTRVTETAFLDFLRKLGLCYGDTLTIHSEHGEIIPIPIDFKGLPHRPAPAAKKALEVAEKAVQKTTKKPRKRQLPKLKRE